MVGPIRSGGVAGVGPIGAAGARGGTRAGTAMRTLAGRIAGRMAREFRLLDDERGHGGGRSDAQDIYELDALARQLADGLGARPVDAGRVARSLGDFAQESAALLAARPEGASLDAIARFIAAREGGGGVETVELAVDQIDQTTRDIVDFRPA